MNWMRAVGAWLMIAVLESVHGTLRQLFIAPAIGDLPSRQLGVLTASALILLVAWLTVRWRDAGTRQAQLQTGALWVVLMLAFEFGLGTALGYPLERLLADYRLAQGGLMPLGMLFMFFAPALAATRRRPDASAVGH